MQKKFAVTVKRTMPSGVYHRTEEARNNISEGQKGRTPWNKGIKTGPLSDAVKIKMGISRTGEKNPNFGKKYSVDRLQQMSDVRKGKKLSEETKKLLSISSSNRRHTEETKNAIRIARIGTKRSEETKRKISNSKKGIKLTPERILLLKERMILWWKDRKESA